MLHEMHFNTITDFIAIVLTFFSSGLAFLMFLGRLMAGEKNRDGIYFALAMLCISLWRFGDGFNYLVLFGISGSSPLSLSIISSISYFFTCPLLYFYINGQIRDQEGLSGRIFPHMIFPAAISIVLLTVLLARAFSAVDQNIIFTVDKTLVRFATVVNCFYALSLLSKMIILFYRGKKVINRLFLLNSIIIILLISTIAFFLAGDKFMLSLLFFFVISLFHVFGDLFNSDLQILKDEAARGKYAKSHIRELDVDAVVNRVVSLMSEDKIYRDEEISLKSLSEKLQLTPHQVSEILNSRMGMNFPTCINYYRIDEARDIFEKDRDASIVTVAYHVGFSSLSSFYSAFKKITGMSPGTYQKYINK